MSTNPKITIGIDGGGTKCSAWVINQDLHVLGKGVAGSANIARDFDNASLSIESAIKAALIDASMPHAFSSQLPPIVAGFAGFNVQSAQKKLALWATQFPSFHATSDLEVSLYGAHAGQNGSVLIVGTGSCSAALNTGQIKQWGGHGFLIGDKGSGAWLGQQAIQRVLLAIDDAATQNDPLFFSTLSEQVGAREAPGLVEQFCQASPATFAKLAPTVVALAEEGSEIALAIVREGASYLSQIAEHAIQYSSGKIAITGGMSCKMAPWLTDEIQEKVSEPAYGAEIGAVLWHKAMER
ncbi:BadF/BadG/BcrA/BcrD ATPase family protein [Alteromonas flava]|uniref:BadF/BadG/BcrA/BcrD ATPase family protein n=1 Tax=Alteromonas flava TaxID=2048003 RepID=UPI0013DC9C75|nr:BadF/BadG/BcrA/BcrD ATPase family protein [Alteromonas flava]